jgi:carboxymethylenebutenolidase
VRRARRSHSPTLALAAALLPISLAALQVRAPGDADGGVPTVRYPSGSASIEAVLQRPAASNTAKSPAVIVVHDDQGVNEAMRSLAKQFAAEGFIALVPNLPSRAAASGDRGRGEPAAAPAAGRGRGSAVAGLPLTQTVDDVKAAFAFLQKDNGVDAAKISVVGFGWGGWRALKLAEQAPSLYRAVVYYATMPDPSPAATIRMPVLGHYAEYDFQTTGNVLATKQRLGDKYTYFVYPDTDRGFAGGGSGAMDFSAAAAESLSAGATGGAPRSPQGIAQAAAKQAWDRTLMFLRGGTPR